MAKNISLMGASYTDVPAVTLPQTGGGTARFDDASVTTATASDVAQGKIFLASDGSITTGTGTGGGGEAVSRSDVNFYDYDGTLLYSFTTAEVNDSGFTMPSNPSHTGLTAQGWNWTLAQLRTQLTAMPTQAVDVGQMYITDDGKTRLYCRFEEGRLHPYLGLSVNGTVVVDWGDGSATSTLTGTSLTETQVADHVYASGGDYMITLTVSSGSAKIFGYSNVTYLLRKANNTTANIHRVYGNALVKVELGTNIGIGDYAFCYCASLTNITIPSGVTSIGAYAFQYCYALANITIPSEVTSISNYTFQYCSALTNITIPSGVTSMGTYAFQYCYALTNITIPSEVTSISNHTFRYCYALTNITIPSEVTSISNHTFQYCYALANITIPSGVTSIGTYTFQGCSALANITIPSEVKSIGTYAFNSDYGLGEIHFKRTTPPTVTNSNTWSNIPTDCKIYVPTGSLSAYTSASNYPSSSTYTYIEE